MTQRMRAGVGPHVTRQWGRHRVRIGEEGVVFRRRGKGLAAALPLLGAPATAARTVRRLRAEQFAVTGPFAHLPRASNCLAFGAEQPVRFSPAFVSTKAARSPPNRPDWPDDLLTRRRAIAQCPSS